MRVPRFAMGLTVAALAVSMTGCTASGGGTDSDTLTLLTLFGPDTPEGIIQQDVIDAFEAETGATVEVTVATEDIPDVFETSTIGGKEADVVVINLVEKSVDWVENGIAVPVNDYLDDWGLRDKIIPDAIDQWTSEDGSISGFPYRGFVWPVWYNLDLLEQAGVDEVPTTTDELIDAAGMLRSAGIAPLVIGGNDWSGQKLFLQIVQQFMSPEETREVYSTGAFCSSDAAMEGIDLFIELRDAGVFIDDAEGYTADQMNATFYEGKAAIMSAGSWAFTDTPADLNVQLGGFPLPSGGTYSLPTAFNGYTGAGFWISNNGVEKLDLVQQFISAWYEPEVAARMTSEANSPTTVVIEGDVEITNPLLAYAATELVPTVDFAVMPDTVVPGSVADPMIRQTSVAFAPGSDAATICGALESVY